MVFSMRLVNFILFLLCNVPFAVAETPDVVAPATIAKAGFVKEQAIAFKTQIEIFVYKVAFLKGI